MDDQLYSLVLSISVNVCQEVVRAWHIQNFVIDKFQNHAFFRFAYIDGLVQDCSNSIPNVLELLQFCAKPSIYDTEENIA